MQEIPTEVREYLSVNDSLARLQLFQNHPGLKDLLEDPQTRAAVLDWLGSEEAWEGSRSTFVVSCLELLRPAAQPSDEQIVRAFLLHPDPFVRLRAYEILLTLYYPEHNRNAMFLLLHGMLSDPDDRVRVSAASYIRGVGAAGELEGFLRRWLKLAPEKGWEGSESFELVQQLLAGSS